jgi:hypothetical protein
MADETTTTTTAQPTTTTTTQAPLSSDEVVLDNAPTETVKAGVTETSQASQAYTSDNLASNVVSKTTEDNEQTQEQNIEEAKAQALRNHAVEHANDPTPKSGDKTVV